METSNKLGMFLANPIGHLLVTCYTLSLQVEDVFLNLHDGTRQFAQRHMIISVGSGGHERVIHGLLKFQDIDVPVDIDQGDVDLSIMGRFADVFDCQFTDGCDVLGEQQENKWR